MSDIRKCPKCGKEHDVSSWDFSNKKLKCPLGLDGCGEVSTNSEWLAPQAEEPKQGDMVWYKPHASKAEQVEYLGKKQGVFHVCWENDQVIYCEHIHKENPHPQETPDPWADALPPDSEVWEVAKTERILFVPKDGSIKHSTPELLEDKRFNGFLYQQPNSGHDVVSFYPAWEGYDGKLYPSYRQAQMADWEPQKCHLIGAVMQKEGE